MNALLMLLKYALCCRIDILFNNYQRVQYERKVRLIFKEEFDKQFHRIINYK